MLIIDFFVAACGFLVGYNNKKDVKTIKRFQVMTYLPLAIA